MTDNNDPLKSEDSPEGRELARKSQWRCDPADLARFKQRSPLGGEIKVGEIYEWEPYLSHAAQALEVVQVDEQKGLVLTRMVERGAGTYWNDITRFRDAVVKSRLKKLPE